MANYDPKSLRAEEFINHEEILATLAYAQEHKNDVALIDAFGKGPAQAHQRRRPLRGPDPSGGRRAAGL